MVQGSFSSSTVPSSVAFVQCPKYCNFSIAAPPCFYLDLSFYFKLAFLVLSEGYCLCIVLSYNLDSLRENRMFPNFKYQRIFNLMYNKNEGYEWIFFKYVG